MATSVIKNAPTPFDALTLTVYQYASTAFAHRSTDRTAKGGATAEFVFPAGDADVDTTLIFAVNDDARGVRHISVRLETVNVILDVDDQEISREPVSVVIAANFPAATLISHLEIYRLISGAFAALTGTLTATVSDADGIDALARGLVSTYPWNPAA